MLLVYDICRICSFTHVLEINIVEPAFFFGKRQWHSQIDGFISVIRLEIPLVMTGEHPLEVTNVLDLTRVLYQTLRIPSSHKHKIVEILILSIA